MDNILIDQAKQNLFFMTKEEFKNQALEMMSCSGSTLYLEATEKFVSALEHIMKTTSDFEQIKSALLNICKDRRDFLAFATDYII